MKIQFWEFKIFYVFYNYSCIKQWTDHMHKNNRMNSKNLLFAWMRKKTENNDSKPFYVLQWNCTENSFTAYVYQNDKDLKIL